MPPQELANVDFRFSIARNKTKCRMPILAIRHPALQSMCSSDNLVEEIK
jgi:hypothetical protein